MEAIELEVIVGTKDLSGERVQKLDPNVASTLCGLIQRLLPTGKILERFGLPASMPVNMQIRLTPTDEMTIPLTFRATNVPAQMNVMRERFNDEVSDLAYEALEGHKIPKELAEALGYNASDKAVLNVHFMPTSGVISPQAMVTAQSCDPGGQFSWGKGCNSWPS